MKELEAVQQNMLVSLASLYPHARNYRSHPPEQIKMLQASLLRFGQVRSIVCQVNADGTYTIIAGHGVVQAAQSLVERNAANYERFGYLRVDVIPTSWDSVACEAYLVADNNINQHASDDEMILAQILEEQKNAGFDLASMGTDDETLRQMLQAMGDEYLGSDESEKPIFKEYDESIADDLDTELCEQCGKLCLKSGKGKEIDA